MRDRPTPTVTGLLAELHAYRVQTMEPAALADVHPDWLVRTEADAVIDAVRALVQVPA